MFLKRDALNGGKMVLSCCRYNHGKKRLQLLPSRFNSGHYYTSCRHRIICESGALFQRPCSSLTSSRSNVSPGGPQTHFFTQSVVTSHTTTCAVSDSSNNCYSACSLQNFQNSYILFSIKFFQRKRGFTRYWTQGIKKQGLFVSIGWVDLSNATRNQNKCE